MKKYLSFAVTAMAILGLGSLTSCHDEDFDVSTAVLQERAFEQGFIKEFGKPDANQSWDFYAQKMQSLREKGAATRAASPDQVVITPAADGQYNSQPAYADAIVSDIVGVKEGNEWIKWGVLQDELDNSHVGQNHYSLTSTGEFNIYPIVYGGDYQKKSQYGFVFGLAYIDGSNIEQKVPLFYYMTSTSSDPINPGWGKHVDFPVGETFYFYMSINIGRYAQGIPYTYTFRSNSSTFTRTYTTTNYYGQTTEHAAGTYEYVDEVIKDENHQVIAGEGPRTYDGPSTLVAAREVKGDDGKDKQIMILGFEDGWQGDPDDDFNDVVLIIEGDLPEPTSKRFFAEDLNSFDWDYNDVVFDVMNTGITLRAVGGTLPVWLRVTDKNGEETITDELHTLMRSIQPQVGHRTKELTYQRMDNGEPKTFYKPIDVGAYALNNKYPGIWFDAVQIIRWKIDDGTRLTDAELERFANPSSSNPLGKIELIVGTEYGQSVEQALAKAEQPDSEGNWEGATEKGNLPKIVTVGETGKIPAIWTGPVSIMWMKELEKITRAYPGFYGGGTTPEGGSIDWWSVETVDKSYCYDYTGDEPD